MREAIYEVIHNQLRDRTPPETQQTLSRLMKAGIPEDEAMKLIGSVVLSEIFDVLKENRPFDEKKYIKALKALPKLPWEDE